ncbi:MAG: glycosyltransferase [Muribaculaceae bacterium]|nr:glycosyltransferase [Muribaculaceae bacterium]
MLVSVIIPVYNTGRYLPRCVDSVLRQTYQQLELILVDDGSTDDSAAVCRNLAAGDDRIKLVEVAHGGVAAARNAGLAAAAGERVSFVDSDDAVSLHFIEELSIIMDRYDSDIAECEWTEFNNPKPLIKDRHDASSEKFFSQDEAIYSSFYQDTLKNSLCRRLFRAELFRDFKFKEGQVFEDLWGEYPLLMRAKRGVAYTANSYYYYIRRNDSTMGKFKPERTVVLRILGELEQRVENEAPHFLPAVRSRLLSASFNMMRKVPDETLEEYHDALEQSWTNIRRLRCGCLRDPRVRRYNKFAILLSYCGKRVFRKIASQI